MTTEVFTIKLPFGAKKPLSFLTAEGLALRMGVDVQTFQDWIEQINQPESPEGKKFRKFLLKQYGEDARLNVFEAHGEHATKADLLEWVEWEVKDILKGDSTWTSKIGQSNTVFYGPGSCPKIVRYWAESGKSAEAQSWISSMLIAGFGEATSSR
jgi:hypothetical protein